MAMPDASTIGKLAEIAENLHRRQISDVERSELIAAWMELRKEMQQVLAGVSAQVGQKVPTGRPKGGLSAAARDLGMTRQTVERALKIDALTPEAKAEGAATSGPMSVGCPAE